MERVSMGDDLLAELTRQRAREIAECEDAAILALLQPVPVGWTPTRRPWWKRGCDRVARWWRQHWRLRVRWEREEE